MDFHKPYSTGANKVKDCEREKCETPRVFELGLRKAAPARLMDCGGKRKRETALGRGALSKAAWH
jgi:hypothetical protein